MRRKPAGRDHVGAAGPLILIASIARWPGAPVFSGLGFAALPRWARRLYGVPASPLGDLATTAALRTLHASTSNGPGDRLILPATRAARNQARAFQRARAARHLTAVP